MNYLLITVIAMIIATTQAAPVSSCNANSDTATTNIPTLKVTAKCEIISVQQEIQLLEIATVRKTLSILDHKVVGTSR